MPGQIMLGLHDKGIYFCACSWVLEPCRLLAMHAHLFGFDHRFQYFTQLASHPLYKPCCIEIQEKH